MATIAYHVMSLGRKMATDSQKDNVFYIRDLFVHVESKCIIQILFECSDNSNMAVNFQDGCEKIPGNAMICFGKKDSKLSKKIIW